MGTNLIYDLVVQTKFCDHIILSRDIITHQSHQIFPVIFIGNLRVPRLVCLSNLTVIRTDLTQNIRSRLPCGLLIFILAEIQTVQICLAYDIKPTSGRCLVLSGSFRIVIEHTHVIGKPYISRLIFLKQCFIVFHSSVVPGT